MDACRLGFADERFDAVAPPFVITLVPDPEGALDECARVLKPGGEIVIASKLGQPTPASWRGSRRRPRRCSSASAGARTSRSAASRPGRGRHGASRWSTSKPVFPGGLLQADAAPQGR